MATPFLGQITVYPYNFPPKGWADCDGQLLPIRQYTALFSLLGTNYGGDGVNTFGLPNLQGRIPIGQGQLLGGADYVMGEAAGEENVTLVLQTMARHNHGVGAVTAAGTINTPSGMVLAMPQVGGGRGGTSYKGQVYNPATPDTPIAPQSIVPVGGSQPHNNIQPSLVLRYCIALEGIFPARN
jgi:microcystin-dependent protein